ncbi:serine protease inhibitor 88Ea-like isoform X2 [Tribolium madens]|uniref:serine protease inhibitor 88Ea-like isoform X2 n=1 Tax=Tribolium madens TaxID=41895 RepID=UPI001CF74B17|nr:serine protease inhibitor 88Ea-like isoform X2 [Tribolium madens]
MKITFASFLLVVLLKHSNQQCLSQNDNGVLNPLGRERLYTGQQEFSLALLQAINQLMPHENLFFSPYSTYHALLIAYFLAGGQTESYLKKILRLEPSQNKPDFYQAYKLDKLQTLRANLNSSHQFTNANKIYVADQIDVRSCIESLFKDELEKISFKNDPEAAKNLINAWVEEHTHKMIKDLLPPGSIDQSSTLVLVNAAYFKGTWENKFNPNETRPEIFYVSPSKQIMVDMMHIEGTFNHDVSESLEAHILEMPYKGSDISMYILLPPFTKEDAIDKTLKKLTLEKFKSIVNSSSLTSKTVQVSFPKFSLEHTVELVPILESLGVGNLFKKDADFSKLSSNPEVSVGRGIHKARIVINEQGAHAAAATAFFTWRMMGDDDDNPIEFKCNRPFVFLIYNKITHTILFTGVLEKMGVGDLFQNGVDFTTLTKSKVELGNALHKARIECNEEGTKAAAATVLFSFRSSRPAEPAQFHCNHPFIYVIYDKVAKAVLFTGVFRRPV